MSNWLEDNIEEGVRDVVKLLRDNGFNTTCSCHHEMLIQCDLHLDGMFQDLHELLFNYFHERGEKCNYRIEYSIRCIDGCFPFTSLAIHLDNREKVQRGGYS